ncbi:MAG: SMC-Scp complex subunit ScpB [Firmicutes bacterium]|nr:SMC-Scp complex subunit ScpB [Bacillota bacterium]MBQ5797020.1 SMC-Scp complex subunit ScpB [Bacillota bacterium]MBR5000445.1 SMC-Scp complex subunit ScpB [Bacillota bacterium]MBR6501050.1 SMC-Scp complex subunit ScpB [Bacillota bacterium]
MTSKKTIKSALESLMFVWGQPLNVKDAAEMFNVPWREVYDHMKELQEEYEEQARGIRIREIDKSFQFCTAPENGEYIERFCTPTKEKKLSQSAMEVLAIIAYKQPVTRSEIESIRGIKCERVIEGLAKKELIEEKGRSNGIGRPILYGTTKLFLEKFGFETLKDLPDIEEIDTLIGRDEDEEALETLDALGFQQISLDLNE